MSLPDQTALSWPVTPSVSTDTSRGGVRSAIARAAGATGVDFQYLMAQARLESSLDPKARAATSSASGLYQFTNATWLQTLQKHGDRLGGVGQGGASTLAVLSDPSARAQLLALRSDPEASAMMAASLAADHQDALSGMLGRQPDASELYLAHFLGIEGAGKFLSALSTNPDQSAVALLPRAAGANRAMFFDGDGAPRSVGGVMDLIRAKMAGAMGDAGAAGFGGGFMPETAPAAAQDVSGGPIAREWAAAQAEMGARVPASMADTLQSTFGGGAGGGDAGGAPDFVRSAYDRFKSFGM